MTQTSCRFGWDETKYTSLGLIHAIKRYCDKYLFLSNWFILTKVRPKVSSKQTTNQGILCFIKSLPWLVIKIHGSKIYLNRNIFLSQYCVQKCLVWIRPYVSPCGKFKGRLIGRPQTSHWIWQRFQPPVLEDIFIRTWNVFEN